MATHWVFRRTRKNEEEILALLECTQSRGMVSLPLVMQTLLSTQHRTYGLRLLALFVDQGLSHVKEFLGVGLYPYVLKLMHRPPTSLHASLSVIWGRLLAIDPSVRSDLLERSSLPYFIRRIEALVEVLLERQEKGKDEDREVDHKERKKMMAKRSSTGDRRHQLTEASQTLVIDPEIELAMLMFSLAVICNNHVKGQLAVLLALRRTLAPIKTILTLAKHPLLKRTACVGLGKIVEHYHGSQGLALAEDLDQAVLRHLSASSPAVRCAAVYAVGRLVRYQTNRHREPQEHSRSQSIYLTPQHRRPRQDHLSAKYPASYADINEKLEFGIGTLESREENEVKRGMKASGEKFYRRRRARPSAANTNLRLGMRLLQLITDGNANVRRETILALAQLVWHEREYFSMAWTMVKERSRTTSPAKSRSESVEPNVRGRAASWRHLHRPPHQHQQLHTPNQRHRGQSASITSPSSFSSSPGAGSSLAARVPSKACGNKTEGELKGQQRRYSTPPRHRNDSSHLPPDQTSPAKAGNNHQLQQRDPSPYLFAPTMQQESSGQIARERKQTLRTLRPYAVMLTGISALSRDPAAFVSDVAKETRRYICLITEQHLPPPLSRPTSPSYSAPIVPMKQRVIPVADQLRKNGEHRLSTPEHDYTPQLPSLLTTSGCNQQGPRLEVELTTDQSEKSLCRQQVQQQKRQQNQRQHPRSQDRDGCGGQLHNREDHSQRDCSESPRLVRTDPSSRWNHPHKGQHAAARQQKDDTKDSFRIHRPSQGFFDRFKEKGPSARGEGGQKEERVEHNPKVRCKPEVSLSQSLSQQQQQVPRGTGQGDSRQHHGLYQQSRSQQPPPPSPSPPLIPPKHKPHLHSNPPTHSLRAWVNVQGMMDADERWSVPESGTFERLVESMLHPNLIKAPTTRQGGIYEGSMQKRHSKGSESSHRNDHSSLGVESAQQKSVIPELEQKNKGRARVTICSVREPTAEASVHAAEGMKSIVVASAGAGTSAAALEGRPEGSERKNQRYNNKQKGPFGIMPSVSSSPLQGSRNDSDATNPPPTSPSTPPPPVPVPVPIPSPVPVCKQFSDDSNSTRDVGDEVNRGGAGSSDLLPLETVVTHAKAVENDQHAYDIIESYRPAAGYVQLAYFKAEWPFTTCVTFHPRRSVLVAAGGRDALRLWDYSEEKQGTISYFRNHNPQRTRVEQLGWINPKLNPLLIAASSDGVIKVWGRPDVKGEQRLVSAWIAHANKAWNPGWPYGYRFGYKVTHGTLARDPTSGALLLRPPPAFSIQRRLNIIASANNGGRMRKVQSNSKITVDRTDPEAFNEGAEKIRQPSVTTTPLRTVRSHPSINAVVDHNLDSSFGISLESPVSGGKGIQAQGRQSTRQIHFHWSQVSGDMITASPLSPMLRLWDVESGLCVLEDLVPGQQTDLRVVGGQSGPFVAPFAISSLERDATGRILFTGHTFGKIYALDLRSKTSRPAVETGEDLNQSSASTMTNGQDIVGLQLQRGGNARGLFLVAKKDGSVTSYDMRRPGRHVDFKIDSKILSRRQSLNAPVAGKDFSSFAVHHFAPLCAVGSRGKEIQLVNIQTGAALDRIKYHMGFLEHRIGAVSSLAFHPSDILLAAGADDEYISIYSGDLRHQIKQTGDETQRGDSRGLKSRGNARNSFIGSFLEPLWK